MDYKAVIEEQIRELQKVQDSLSKRIYHNESTSCEVAKTIAFLCNEADRHISKERMQALRKEVAAMNEQASRQPEKFIPEDSSGTTYSPVSISTDPRSTTQE